MKKEFIGMGAVLGYCCVSAFSRVYANYLLQDYDPFLWCFYIFTVSAAIFFILNLKEIAVLYTKVRANYTAVIYLNLTTLGSWLFLVYPLKFIQPAIVSTITLGVGPVISLLLSSKLYSQDQKSFLDISIAIGLLSIIFFLGILCLSGNYTDVNISIFNRIFSLACCLIVGVSIVLNGFQNRKLINKKFTSLDILSIRFFLLIFASGIIAYFNTSHIHLMNGFLNINTYFSALIFVVLPLYLIQVGLQRLRPITVSGMIPLMPVLTYFFQFQEQNTATFTVLFYIILATFFLVSMNIYFRARGKIIA